jgi:hypothetical protein
MHQVGVRIIPIVNIKFDLLSTCPMSPKLVELTLAMQSLARRKTGGLLANWGDKEAHADQ